MKSMFKVKLLTPKKNMGEFATSYLQIPGFEGYRGMGSNHAPMISELRPGVIRIQDEGSAQSSDFYVSGGFVECRDNVVTILTQALERANEIDRERLEKSLKRAEERLKETTDKDLDIVRALASLERAKARRKLLEMQKQNS